MRCALKWCFFFLLLGQGGPQAAVAQRQAGKPVAGPRRQQWRVNDTLVLEYSQPFAILPQHEEPSLMMWSHLALRGRRGYYHVLSQERSLYCTYRAVAAKRGDVVHFSVLEPGSMAQKPQRGQPLPANAIYYFDYQVWDVRYRTLTGYLNADLEDWDPRQWKFYAGETLSGVTYHLLPYWIGRERAHLARTHRLPALARVRRYIALSQELAANGNTQYTRGYGPLLARLLRAYRAYPLPAPTARRLDQGYRALARTLRAPFLD